MGSGRKVPEFIHSKPFNHSITALIIASLLLLLVQKLINFPVKIDRILGSIDIVILLLFSVEFLLRLFFLGKKYFIRDLGWIDLLAALPVLTPLIMRLTISLNSDLFLMEDALNITILLRGFKFIRFLRVVRSTRLLKFLSSINKRETEVKTRYPVFLPVIVSLMLLMLAYGFSTIIENNLTDKRFTMMTTQSRTTTKDNAENLMDIYPEILMIKSGSSYFRSLSDKEIKGNFHPSELGRTKHADVYILYSIQDIQQLTNGIEAVILIIIMLYICASYLQYHFVQKNIATQVEESG
jgi:hypothetical protein